MIFNSSFSQKTLNILKASLPFIPPGMQRMVSNFVKIEEFNIMVRNLNDSLDATVSACEYSAAGNYNGSSFNTNDFISAIKPYLDDRERELIDMLFNMMNALKIYNLYKSFPSAVMPDEQNFGGINFNNFDFDSKSTGSQETEHHEEYRNDTDIETGSREPDNLISDNQIENTESSAGNAEVLDYQDYNDSDYADTDKNSQEPIPKETDENTAAQNDFNIEALKNLLTPGQRAMFETYSALLNNNSNIN